MAKMPSRTSMRQKLRDRRRKRDDERKVPGPTDNPATNIMLADVAIRAGSYIVRRTVEKGFLKGRYGKQTASDILNNRTLGQTVVSYGLAKVASRSLPGALIVGGGAAAKALYDRRKSKRRQQVEGDRELIEQANSDE